MYDKALIVWWGCIAFVILKMEANQQSKCLFFDKHPQILNEFK